MSEASDETNQLIRDLIERVDAGFRANGANVEAIAKVANEAHAGVTMALAGIESIGEALAQQAVVTRDLSNGLVNISTQISQLRDGVASQVRHEVLKSLDGTRSIEVLAALPQEERER